MLSTSKFTTTLLILTVLFVFLPSGTYAFGAGDIPDFAYLNDKAFRHGDIENILEQLVKYAGRGASGGGLLGFAAQVISSATGGSKFSKGDVKKVYFGNWLRDYSQAMDIAGLSKLSADTLVLVVAVLGFMTFGFATEEYEVTADRLGVYLPVEHIDNPKGYAEKEGDARQFHPKLRPPVDPRELEVDERTGMKNYMATEGQGWDTSTAHIRRTFQACIEHGRRSGGQDGADLYEAYRLMGTGLHTLEDLLAHSNWCEIALRKLGYNEVFCHVGEDTQINTPNGPAPPLVTGTFGSADFLHSLMGEATDHLSQASVTALSEKMSSNDDASSKISALKDILGKFGGGDDDKLNQGEQMQSQAQAYRFDPNNIAPPEVQRQLLDFLKWRDNVYRDILKKIEMIPGLSDALEELTNALNAYVYTTIAPWLTPILEQATSVLGEGSKAVIDSDDQYEVFDNPRASDPSHSLLSKDHFGLILNEPAGKIAQVVVIYTVQLLVQAWSDDSNPDQVIDRVLEAFHHPYYATGRSDIQNQMFQTLQRWLSEQDQNEILQALTKDSVRNGRNKRKGGDENQVEAGYGHGHGGGGARSQQNQSSYGGGNYGSQRTSGYGGRQDGDSNSRRNDEKAFSQSAYRGENQSSYNSSRRDDGYERRRQEDDSYGSRQDTSSYGSRRQDNNSSSYGTSEGYGSRRQEDDSYGSGRNTSNYGASEGYGSQRREDISDRRYGESDNYDPQRRNEGSYGSQRRENEAYNERHQTTSYGRSDEQGYGRGEDRSYADSYGGRDTSGYGRSEEYGTHRNEGHRSEGHSHSERRHDEYGSRRDENDAYGRDQSNYEGDGSYGRTETESYGRGDRHGSHGDRSGYEGRDTRGGNDYSARAEGGYAPSYGGSEGQYGESRSHNGGNRDYNPSYANRGYGEGETFGAERLNIGDNNERSGYGRDEYGSSRRNNYDSNY